DPLTRCSLLYIHILQTERVTTGELSGGQLSPGCLEGQMKSAFSALRLLFGMGLLAGCAWSQTAQITGTLTDASGAIVPNAQVMATNTETGVSRSSVTNESGNYLITALFPGPYRVTATSAGFKQMKREGITLAVEQVARIDFR